MSDCDLCPTAVGRGLHALEPEDERVIVEHLPHCAACRRTLRETYGVTTLLAAAVPAVDPPAALRDRVLALADATGEPEGPDATDRRVRAAGPTPTAPIPPAPPPATVEAEPPGPPGPQPSGSHRWGLLAVAAVILGVVLLSARVLLPGAGTGGVDDPAGSSTQALADRADRIVDGAEAADPAGRHATLFRSDGTVAAVVLDDAEGARVIPLALPSPMTGRAYFLWRVVGAQPVPVGAVDPAGVTTRSASGPTPGGPRATAYAISLEPAGAQPRTPSDLVADGLVV